jgi:protein TonB
MMSYWKSLQISLIFHGIVLLALVSLNTMSPIRPQNILVIDFSMESESLLQQGKKTADPSLPAKTQKGRKKGHTKEDVRNLQNEARKPAVVSEVSVNEKIVHEEIPQKEAWTSLMTVSETTLDTAPGIAEFSQYSAQNIIHESGFATAGSSGLRNTGTGAGSGSRAVTSYEKTKYIKAHYSYIKDLVFKHLIYPAKARKMGWEGKVITSFIVSSAGNAKDVRIAKSSGHQILDESAVRAINDASPFPKPPAEAQIIIPILYRLN